MKKYPDVSELFALKEARRQRLAGLPPSQKMEITNRLRKLSCQLPKITPKRQGAKVRTAAAGK